MGELGGFGKSHRDEARNPGGFENAVRNVRIFRRGAQSAPVAEWGSAGGNPHVFIDISKFSSYFGAYPG